jgi:hypothetical protein
VKRIPPEQKNRFPEVLCGFLNTAGAKIRPFALWKIPLSAEMALQRGPPAVSYTATLEQIALREILLLEEIQG